MRGCFIVLAFAAGSALAVRTTNFPVNSQLGTNMTNWHTVLRAHILAQYDKNSPPISDRKLLSDRSGAFSLASMISDAGTDVSLQLRVLKLDAIDVNGGTISVKVWLRMQWKDLRLAWNPADFGGLHTVRFWGHNPDNSEIWVPDITPYNTRTPIADSLSGGWIEAYASGGTFFTRHGTLDAMCKLSGLVKFPFDTDLRCDLDFGGWLQGGAVQGIYLTPGANPGVDYHAVTKQMLGAGQSSLNTYGLAAERSTGSTYQPYVLFNVTASMSNITFDCCPQDPYPVATYTFYITRTTKMMTIILFPLGFLTFLIFYAFYMPPDDVNRISFCVLILLIVMVMKDYTYVGNHLAA